MFIERRSHSHNGKEEPLALKSEVTQRGLSCCGGWMLVLSLLNMSFDCLRGWEIEKVRSEIFRDTTYELKIRACTHQTNSRLIRLH